MWFYYKFSSEDCESPVDDIMNTMIILYSISIAILIISSIFIIKTDDLLPLACCKFLIAILIIIMLVLTQKKYNKSWETNTCENLKSLTKGWLIWNYIHIGLDGLCLIYSIFLMIYMCYEFGKD